MKIKIFWAWFDFWIGAYWDTRKKILYICPLPTIVIKIWRKADEEGDISFNELYGPGGYYDKGAR